MSHLLNSGQVGNIGINHMKAIRQQTQQRWDSLGFLDGLKGHVKENIAQLFENQASSLLNESTAYIDKETSRIMDLMRRVDNK